MIDTSHGMTNIFPQLLTEANHVDEGPQRPTHVTTTR